MSPSLSDRMSLLSESETLKLNAIVQSLKAKGETIFNFTAGEPDFNVPNAAKEAVMEALRTNQSKYTPAAGILELRKLIAEKTNHQQPSVAKEMPWGPQNVLVTNGGKQALYNALLAIVNPGDEVLIPSPYWLSYPEMVRLAGGTPVFIQTSAKLNFKMTAEQLKLALNPKVKALILNSPSNPTGSMYTSEEFSTFGKIIRDTPDVEDLWVISDEIYDRITFGKIPFSSFLESSPFLRDRCITVNGMSKSAAMTGWRVGWLVGPESLVQATIKLQGQTTSGINSLAQWASVAALKLPEDQFKEQVERFKKRRDLVLEILGKSAKINIIHPDGAFYAFVGLEGVLGPNEDAAHFSEKLLQEAKVAVVAGNAFGAPKYFRLSFATDEKTIQEGCKRIKDYVEKNYS